MLSEELVSVSINLYCLSETAISLKGCPSIMKMQASSMSSPARHSQKLNKQQCSALQGGWEIDDLVLRPPTKAEMQSPFTCCSYSFSIFTHPRVSGRQKDGDIQKCKRTYN